MRIIQLPRQEHISLSLARFRPQVDPSWSTKFEAVFHRCVSKDDKEQMHQIQNDTVAMILPTANSEIPTNPLMCVHLSSMGLVFVLHI